MPLVSKDFNFTGKHAVMAEELKQGLLEAVVYYTQISIIISLALLILQKDQINKKNLNEDLDKCLISKSYYDLYKEMFIKIKEYL